MILCAGRASGPLGLQVQRSRNWTILSLGIAAALVSACSTQSDDDYYSFTPDPERVYTPITDAGAPAISDLKRQGLKQTYWDADHYACAADCDAMYVYAYYYGQATPDELCPSWRDESEGGLEACRKLLVDASEYVCPATDDQSNYDSWTCRRLD